jgi:alpha-L-fucosidase
MSDTKVTIPPGPFEPNWDSLEAYEVPDWYVDGKFGIFIHWGPYCVPAFGNEWYPRQMYKADTAEFAHHIETWGPQNVFGYKDFFPLFKAERFDASAWADLFAKSGARFICPVAEHHDGFAMYDSGFSRWCATKIGPMRDVIGELATAVRERGMVFGCSTHREEHWWFFDQGMAFDSDVKDPEFADLYGPAEPENTPPNDEYLEDWLARTCEIIDKYQPQLLWFDWWINTPAFAPYLQRLAAYYYNRGAEWGKGVAINYKEKAFREGTAVYDIERGQLAGISPLFWQNDTSVSKNSWGYIEGQDYKTVDSIIDDLVDIVSKNGALLLNVCPKSDGTIPAPEQQMLLEIGQWLQVNGEAIYGTRPWKAFGEGPTEVAEGGFTDTKRADFTAEDIRFTTKGDTLYATALALPESGKIVVKTLAACSELCPQTIASVELLGAGEVKWTRDCSGLTVELPSEKPCECAFVLKITLA